ncbi:hypothetical protein V6N13_031073 [Hibiscus sabdariffa]|uniref:Uncharacterized protein n=1 Tax=Hibiscus sabdariffa TaxID=183260 RepID=A0ABR2CLQ3_9ROSI
MDVRAKRISWGIKIKQVLLFPFTKFKRRRRRKRTKTIANRPWYSCSGRRVFSGGGFCCRPPRILESVADESKSNDPNDPTFTYEMLRTLIEKNHFYSDECNPHSD